MVLLSSLSWETLGLAALIHARQAQSGPKHSGQEEGMECGTATAGIYIPAYIYEHVSLDKLPSLLVPETSYL